MAGKNHEQLAYSELVSSEDFFNETLDDHDSFDLDSFFDADELPVEEVEEVEAEATLETIQPIESDLLLTLRDESNQVVQNFSTKVTAAAFNTSASFVSSASSLIGSLIGACGPVCFHTLGSVAQMSSGITGASGLAGGLSMNGFNVDSKGNFRLDGNIDSLSQSTGLSKADLLAGKFSAEQILLSLSSVFGQGISILFGFGLVGGIIDSIFDNFLVANQAA